MLWIKNDELTVVLQYDFNHKKKQTMNLVDGHNNVVYIVPNDLYARITALVGDG